MQQSKNSNWFVAAWHGLVKLDFISHFFTWLMELLARVTEPLASFSAIYIIIVAGVPALHNDRLYVLALALIIGSPELLVVGAFKIASHEIGQGNKKGWWLMASCFVLLILTALTVGDLFIWHWDPTAVNVLMGFRCLAGISYAFTRGVVTDRAGEFYSGSQVHTTLEEIAAGILERVHLVNQQTLAEVNRVNQFTLAEVHRIAQDVNQNYQMLLSAVNRVNQEIPAHLNAAIDELGQQGQQALDAAVERLERSNSRRLETVYTRLEQVRVTLESNPALPAVNSAKTPLRIPSRAVHSETVNQAQAVSEPVNDNGVNSSSEAGDGSFDNKVNQGRAFTVNHWKEHGSLPTLGMIIAAVTCSKTLASRARGLAEQDLGLKPVAGD